MGGCFLVGMLVDVLKAGMIVGMVVGGGRLDGGGRLLSARKAALLDQMIGIGNHKEGRSDEDDRRPR